MNAAALRDALDGMPDDAEVICVNTSVPSNASIMSVELRTGAQSSFDSFSYPYVLILMARRS